MRRVLFNLVIDYFTRNKMLRRFLVLFISLSIFAYLGCAGGAPVEGTVSYKGQPVDGATVSLQTDDGNPVGTGVTDGVGHFRIKSLTGTDLIPSGTYKVTVTKSTIMSSEIPTDVSDPAVGKMMKNMKKNAPSNKDKLPDKFASSKSTTLAVKVPTAGSIEFKLD